MKWKVHVEIVIAATGLGQVGVARGHRHLVVVVTSLLHGENTSGLHLQPSGHDILLS